MDFTELFRDALERRGLSHARFADRVGVTPAFVSMVATKRSKPPLERITFWAKSLELSDPDYTNFIMWAHLAHCPDVLRDDYLRLRARVDRVEQRVAALDTKRDVSIDDSPIIKDVMKYIHELEDAIQDVDNIRDLKVIVTEVCRQANSLVFNLFQEWMPAAQGTNIHPLLKDLIAPLRNAIDELSRSLRDASKEGLSKQLGTFSGIISDLRDGLQSAARSYSKQNNIRAIPTIHPSNSSAR